MTKSFLYSPLSPSSVADHKALLILFILKELVNNLDAVIDDQPIDQGPLEWTLIGTPSNKLREHFLLLSIAFPGITTPKLKTGKPFQDLIRRMAPYIHATSNNENILLFLFKHQNILAVKQLLDKICPEGMDSVKIKMAEGFKKRGRWIHLSKTA